MEPNVIVAMYNFLQALHQEILGSNLLAIVWTVWQVPLLYVAPVQSAV